MMMLFFFLKGSDGDESHSAAPQKPPELKSHQKILGLGDGESKVLVLVMVNQCAASYNQLQK